MKKTNTKVKNQDILDKVVPKKMIGLLLKEDQSPSDLAQQIYGRRNARSGILKWLKEFDKRKWIERKDLSVISGKKKLFRAKLSLLGDFNKEEREFVDLLLSRFWNPIRTDPIGSIKSLIIECLAIKKIYPIKPILNGYDPKLDWSKYEKVKDEFWKNKYFRKQFLDDVENNPKNIEYRNSVYYMKRDFIFVSLLVPDSIEKSIMEDHLMIGSPSYLILKILN